MANPTTNYGWPMPTSTDLVTDLPADFAAFGQPVDTSLKALNPETTLGDISYRSATANTNTRLPIGTTGQVLAVSGGVPAWTTTADVTPLTTKGDLFTFTTVDARLGVGTNGQVLQADSAEATGLKWATPATGTTFSGAQASFSASGQTVSYTQNSNLILSFNYENYDTDGYHNTGSNQSRMTVPTGKGGYFLLAANGIFLGTVPGVSRIILYKNGTQYGEALSYGGRIGDTAGNNNLSLIGSAVVAGSAGDYFEIAYQGDLSTGSKTAYGSFTIAYLGA